MQEFLGIRYQTKVSHRLQHKYRAIVYVDGYVEFRFRPNVRDRDKHCKNHIKKSKEKILKIMEKLQKNKKDSKEKNDKYFNEYLAKNPNSLIIFNKSYDISSLSIESISEMLYQKSINILDRISANMGVKYSKLTISTTKGYLGQCKRNKANEHEIKIDYRLSLCDESLLEYLIVHELAHIRHKNHSPRFWQEVAKYYPNYKAVKTPIKDAANHASMILKHYNLLPKRLW